MGKDDKEDSGFGFKDKAKALETLRLLEAHDANYRRLTVRGLLGRAKRVLSMTKAEDKIKNIKEAMEVFENWLAELADQKNNKTDKEDKKSSREDKKKAEKKSDSGSSSSSSDVEMEEKKEKQEKPEKQALPSDSVPGLGFKDAEAARGSLTELRGRDPEYQRLAVKGLIGRAKRVLTCTRDETKISNIKEAMEIFEKFLDEFESLHLSRQNNPYVSLGIVRTAQKQAGDNISEQQTAFIAAYASVRGEYKRLRTVTAPDGDKTWDIVRNTALSELKEKYADAKLFNEKDEPTPEHIQMLLWAYSPEPARAKKYVPETKEEREKDSGDRKRRHSDKDENSDRKRRSSGRDDESPSKRSKE